MFVCVGVVSNVSKNVVPHDPPAPLDQVNGKGGGKGGLSVKFCLVVSQTRPLYLKRQKTVALPFALFVFGIQSFVPPIDTQVKKKN